MTRTEIQAVVEDMIARTDKEDVIINGIDFAIKEFTKEHDFQDFISSEDLTTTSGTSYVALSDESDKIIEARLIDGTNSYSILQKTKNWISKRFPNPDGDPNNKPVYCYIEGGNLYLVPVPDDAYTIRLSVVSSSSDLSGDSSENPLDGLDYAIACWAAGYVMDSIERFDAGQQWRVRAQDSLAKSIRWKKRQYRNFQHEGAKSVGRGKTRAWDPLVGYNWSLDES